MVTHHTAGGLNRRCVISDAAAGMPTPSPQYPATLPHQTPRTARQQQAAS
ncbi:hypothetical protein [Streptomyces sp. NPDC057910]|nr:hypothetical protein [Streptomyces sp. MAG02]